MVLFAYYALHVELLLAGTFFARLTRTAVAAGALLLLALRALLAAAAAAAAAARRRRRRKRGGRGLQLVEMTEADDDRRARAPRPLSLPALVTRAPGCTAADGPPPPTPRHARAQRGWHPGDGAHPRAAR